MNIGKGLVIFILLFYNFSFLSGEQNYRFKNISIEDGLPSSFITSIVQDNQGFIWIGTYNGIVRYDGQTFRHFLNESDDQKKTNSIVIKNILQDSSGNIWVLTRNRGLYKFISESNKYKRYHYGSGDLSGLKSNYILSIIQDRKGIVWVGTRNSLNKFNSSKNKFKQYQIGAGDPNSLNKTSIRTIMEDRYGKMWIGTHTGDVLMFDRNKEIFHEPDLNFKKLNNKNKKDISFIFEDSFKNIWIGSYGNGLSRISKPNNIIISYRNIETSNLNSDYVHSIYEDSSQTIWIGTENGLYKYKKSTDSFLQIKKNKSNPNSISSNYIFSIFQDNSGIIWLGTREGINLLDKNKNIISLFQNIPNNKFSISGNSVWAFAEDRKNNIWIGTVNGLNKFNRKKKTFIRYYDTNRDIKNSTNNKMYRLIIDHKGYIWIGHDFGVLKIFDPGKEIFTKINLTGKQNEFGSDSIKFLYEDKVKNMWIATVKGLYKLNKKRKLVKLYKHDPADSNSLRTNIVNSITEDRSGILWLSTNKGLIKFNKKTERFFTYHNKINDPATISDDRVGPVVFDNNGSAWVGTFGGGLNKYNINKNNFSVYTVKDGLPNNYIYGIIIDNENNLWISTAKGLSFFNTKQRKFHNFDRSYGIQGYKYHDCAYFKSSSGELYFGGSNGFNIVDPKKFSQSIYMPPVKITLIEIMNNVGKFKKNMGKNQKIDLHPEDYYITFNFATLDYSNPKRNKYAYKLDGLEDKWLFTDGKKPFATYTTLPPDKYVFKVKGTNSDGIWNEKISSVTLIVHPPFWRTFWFKGLIFLFFIFIVIWGYKKRIKKLEIKFQKEANDKQIFKKFNISHREQEIIILLLKKKSRKEIEDILFISAHTVKNHIYNIFKKLGIKSKGELHSFFSESSNR